MEFESPAFRMIEIEVGVSFNESYVLSEYDNMLDVEYFQRKLAGALMIPKEYLNA